MIIIDPVTQQRIVSDNHAGDIQYKRKNASPSVINEDYPYGHPENNQPLNRQKIMSAGQENKHFGTDAGLRGVKERNLTARGNPKNTTITKQVDVRVKIPS